MVFGHLERISWRQKVPYKLHSPIQLWVCLGLLGRSHLSQASERKARAEKLNEVALPHEKRPTQGLGPELATGGARKCTQSLPVHKPSLELLEVQAILTGSCTNHRSRALECMTYVPISDMHIAFAHVFACMLCACRRYISNMKTILYPI